MFNENRHTSSPSYGIKLDILFPQDGYFECDEYTTYTVTIYHNLILQDDKLAQGLLHPMKLLRSPFQKYKGRKVWNF